MQFQANAAQLCSTQMMERWLLSMPSIFLAFCCRSGLLCCALCTVTVCLFLLFRAGLSVHLNAGNALATTDPHNRGRTNARHVTTQPVCKPNGRSMEEREVRSVLPCSALLWTERIQPRYHAGLSFQMQKTPHFLTIKYQLNRGRG